MAAFQSKQCLADFQKFIGEVYTVSDDRLFSISDLLSNQERFTMRALKGIRKADPAKLKYNTLIAFSWFMAVANRLHIAIEDHVWNRFPMLCSYCGNIPCQCKKMKLEKRKGIKKAHALKPGTMSGFQEMFAKIYPPDSRTLADAGVHLAEEIGELSEAVHSYLGEHTKRKFEEVADEAADYASCIFGVANSGQFDIARELAKLYDNNCHVCHKAPCECNFYAVAEFKS